MRPELTDPAFSSPLSSSLSELLGASSALAGLSLCRMLVLLGYLSTPEVRGVRLDSLVVILGGLLTVRVAIRIGGGADLAHGRIRVVGVFIGRFVCVPGFVLSRTRAIFLHDMDSWRKAVWSRASDWVKA